MNSIPIQGNSYIIITSIFPPTKAVEKFANLKDYKLIIAGDKKTPKDWHVPNVQFLPIESQIEGELCKHLPFNHYCRKNYAYLQAIWQGAEIIIDTDDDNIPYPSFSKVTPSPFSDNIWDNNWDTVDENLGFVNIYQLYSDQKIWPRGLPLQLINTDFNLKQKTTQKRSKVGIWQGLADGDPDVDAIYRLVDGRSCTFDKRSPNVLDSGTICPFNSQNTIFIKALFPLLYLPMTVTFRFTDILRGLIAQPIMWSAGYQLGFTQATVFQDRNPHNYIDDFKSEVSMYLQCEKAVDIAVSQATSNKSISDMLFDTYCTLQREKIVLKEEVKMVEAWLKDLQKSI